MKNNNKQLSYSLKLTVLIFSCYIVSSIINGFIAFILYKCGLVPNKGGIILMIFIVLISCSIIAFILTYLQLRNSNKFMEQMKKCLSSMANGDFSNTITVSVKNPDLNEISQDINTVIKELNSLVLLKNDFVKNFSHEFKTPIASIKGFSEILCSNNNLSEEDKQKYLNIIKQESTRLSNLANMTLLSV